jgi:hypothetical protein
MKIGIKEMPSWPGRRQVINSDPHKPRPIPAKYVAVTWSSSSIEIVPKKSPLAIRSKELPKANRKTSIKGRFA